MIKQWRGVLAVGLALVALGAAVAVVPARPARASVAHPLVLDRQDYPSQARNALATGDINGDGLTDVVAGAASDNGVDFVVGVRLQQSNGALGPESDIAVASPPTALAIADLDGNGRLDLAYALSWPDGQKGIWVSYQSSGGVLQPPVRAVDGSGTVGGTVVDLVALDLNGDGRQDLVFGDQGGVGVSAALQQANHTLSVVSLGGSVGTTGVLAVGDLNNDARPDVVWSAGTDTEVQLQHADHTFAAPVTEALAWPSGPNVPNEIAIADINGDGRPDVALTDGEVVVADQLASGHFAVGTTQPPSVATTTNLAIADLNGDGHVDLIERAGPIRVLEQTTGGAFPTTPILCGDSAIDTYEGGTITTDDVNGDGVRDIVAATNTGVRVCYGAAQNRGPLLGDLSGVSASDYVSGSQGVANGVAIPIPVTDPDGNSITVTVTAAPAHGVIAGSWPNLTFTAAAGYTGDDAFTLQADDHHRRVSTRTYPVWAENPGSIIGVVTDGAAPIDGAIVDLYSRDEPTPILSVLTDSTGSFSFANLTRYRQWFLHAHDPSGTHLDEWYQRQSVRPTGIGVGIYPGGVDDLGQFLLPPTSTVFPVTTTADGGPGSLRETVAHMAGLAYLPQLTIQLADHATYDLGCTGELAFRGPVTVEGHGSTIRQTCAGSRVAHQMDFDTLTFADVTLTGGSLTDPAKVGGAITGYTLAFDGATVTGNHAAGDGGAIASTGVNLVDSTVADNSAGGSGGGIASSGVRLTGSTVSGNTATGDGGGITSNSTDATDSTIADNRATGRGGGVSSGYVWLTRTTLTGNQAGTDGGGIAAGQSVNSTDSNASGNQATRDGGGIWTTGGAWTGGSIRDNTAHRNGGGVMIDETDPQSISFDHTTLTGNTGDAAGGAAFGDAYVIDSTVSANHALVGGAWSGPTGSYVQVSSSTLDGNDATQSGGALAVPHNGHGSLSFSTVTANGAPVGSAFASDGTGSATVRSSVLALSPSASLCSGAFVGSSSTGSFFADASCPFASGPLVGAGDPKLGPMADNGGPTATRIPLDASPLIDAIAPTDPSCPMPASPPGAPDQSDHPRTRGMGCDPGSVEHRPTGSAFTPLAPVRILDTRTGPVPLGRAVGQPLTGGTSLTLPVAGTNGIPADATAVVLNITSVNATKAGYVTAWPAFEARPSASSLNLQPGAAVANLVTVKVGAGGAVRLYTDAGQVDLAADVFGYYSPSSTGLFTPTAPQRILDTRSAKVPAGRTPGAPLAGGTSFDQPVADVGGVPADVTAVVVNVTSTQATKAGFVTVWPAGTNRPPTSNLNLQPGSEVANLVTVAVGAGGAISLFTDAGQVHLVVDLVGYYRAGSGSLFFPLAPIRHIDTRLYPGLQFPGYHLSSGFNGWTGVDSDATAVEMNLTAVNSSDKGYATLYPSDVAAPATSTLNYRPGYAVPNMAITRLGGSDRSVTAFNPYGTTHLIMDVGGYFAPPS